MPAGQPIVRRRADALANRDLSPTTPLPEPLDLPELSIVIVTRDVDKGFEGRLHALYRERAGDAQVEIIVAVAGDTLALLEERFPDVVFLSIPGDRPIAAVRAAAVRRARGRNLALLTPACRVQAGWLGMLRAALEVHPVVGGAVEPDARGWGIRDWAAFWCEYGHYLPPLPPGPASDLSGNNVAYRRQILVTSGALDQVEGLDSFWKAVAHRRLRAARVDLWVEPALIVRHEGRVVFGAFLRRRFDHGRCYAAGRIADEPGLRWRTAGAAPLLPALFTTRLYAGVWPKRRYQSRLLFATPLLWLLYLFWAVGELVGAVSGGGDSCERAY